MVCYRVIVVDTGRAFRALISVLIGATQALRLTEWTTTIHLVIQRWTRRVAYVVQQHWPIVASCAISRRNWARIAWISTNCTRWCSILVCIVWACRIANFIRWEIIIPSDTWCTNHIVRHAGLARKSAVYTSTIYCHIWSRTTGRASVV